MTDEPRGIQPALTAAEWAEVSRASTGDFNTAPMAYGLAQVLGDRRHATAALCLYGQPFGFTAEGVVLLRYLVEGHDLTGGESSGWIDRGISRAQVERLMALADRIAALLPPTEYPRL